VIDDLSEVEDIDLREAFGKLLGKKRFCHKQKGSGDSL